MSDIFRPLLPAGVGKTYVEIGGVKWATMNIGANSVTDYGLYFQWGDTTGYTASQVGTGNYQKPFNWADCVLHNGTSSYDNTTFTKYNGDDRLTELEPINDAAVANWGGNWRMPTTEEFQALKNATTNEWVTNYNGSGVAGRLFTSKSDSSVKIFFPAAGTAYYGYINSAGSQGYYWTSVASFSESRYANYCQLNSNNVGLNGLGRYYGYSVRPVLDE